MLPVRDSRGHCTAQAQLPGGLKCCHLSQPEDRTCSKEFKLNPLRRNPPLPRLPPHYSSRDSTAMLAMMTSHHHTHRPAH